MIFLWFLDIIDNGCFFIKYINRILRKRIEVVITGLTRKRMTFLEAHLWKTLILRGFSAIIEKWISLSSLHQFSPFSEVFLRADVKINTRSGIEVVITGLTRNQLYLRVPWVRIPPTPPENSVCKRFLPFAGFFFFLHLWDFSVSSLLKIGSSLLNFLRFELWICS